MNDQPLDIQYGDSSRSGGKGYTSRGAISYINVNGVSSLSSTVQRDSLDRIRAWIGGSTAHSTAYAYDGLGRLIADSSASGTPYTGPSAIDSAFSAVGRYASPTVTTYSYDAAGNRTDHSGAYAAGNRLLRFNSDTIEHDLDGNVTRRYNRTIGRDIRYTWDELGRLVKIANAASGDSAQYAYDALDRLVQRKVNGSADWYAAWDGDNIAAEMDGSFAGAMAYWYDGTDQPVVVANSYWGPRYVIQDAVGNIAGLTLIGSLASLTQTIDYSSWGHPTTNTYYLPGSTLLWKGLHWENNAALNGISLYYMRARWYDPDLGRFLSEDPVGIKGGMNLYAFGGNDPINAVDPMGNRPLNDYERYELSDICHDADCDLVDVRDGHDDLLTNALRRKVLESSQGRSITLGNAIYLADDDIGNIAVLAHEMTHFVQFHKWGAGTFAFTAMYDHWWLEPHGVGLYQLPQRISPNDHFSNFSMEQQGQIVEDCFKGYADRCAISPYKPPSSPYVPWYFQSTQHF